MQQRQKRFQYWANKKIKWSKWFIHKGPENSIQLKGFKGNDLLNEYRDILE